MRSLLLELTNHPGDPRPGAPKRRPWSAMLRPVVTERLLIHPPDTEPADVVPRAGSGHLRPVAPDPDDALFGRRVDMTFVIDRSRVAVATEG